MLLENVCEQYKCFKYDQSSKNQSWIFSLSFSSSLMQSSSHSHDFSRSILFAFPNTDHLWQQIWISWPFCLGFAKYWSMVSHFSVPTEFGNGLSTSLFPDSSFWSEYFSLERLRNIFAWISCSVSINYLLVYDSSSVSALTESFTNLIRSSLIFNLALYPLSASL